MRAQVSSVLRRLLDVNWRPPLRQSQGDGSPRLWQGALFLMPVERTFDFMGLIMFILAYSRMKPKKQEAVLFRGSTMGHLQHKPLGAFPRLWWGLSWKPELYNSFKERAWGKRGYEARHWGQGENALNSQSCPDQSPPLPEPRLCSSREARLARGFGVCGFGGEVSDTERLREGEEVGVGRDFYPRVIVKPEQGLSFTVK